METKTIPTSKLRKRMAVVGNVRSEHSPLPCYVPPVHNIYYVVSVVHIKEDRIFPGWYIVTLCLPGLDAEGKDHLVVMQVTEGSWWHTPVGT